VYNLDLLTCSCFSHTHTRHTKVPVSIANASGFMALNPRATWTSACSNQEATAFVKPLASFDCEGLFGRCRPRFTEGGPWGARQRDRSLVTFVSWVEPGRHPEPQTCRQIRRCFFWCGEQPSGCYPKVPIPNKLCNIWLILPFCSMLRLLRFFSRVSLVSQKSVLGCMSSVLKVGPI